MSPKLGASFIQTIIVTLFQLSFFTFNPFAARNGPMRIPEYQLFRPYSSNQCPPLDIANGYVRIGRRTARFRCQRNFTLVGDQVIYCRGQEWSKEAPVCAASGCLKLRAPKQGKIKSTYRDVSATISCNPGYSVDGSATVFCDGRYWNASYTQISNMCKKSLKNPPNQCDFESFSLCGWTSDDPDRVILTGPDTYGYRPFGIAITDHSGTGHMMIVFGSSSLHATNRLYSPVYEEKQSEACLTFWYHLGEVNKITSPPPFKVYIKPELITLSDITPWDFVTPTEAYGKWTRGQIYIPKINQDWQVVLEFSSSQNVYAFDDFLLQDATQCATRTTQQFVGIKNNWLSCKDRCTSSLALEPASFCSCVIYCTFLDTCCPDYSLYCLANSTIEDNDDLMDFDKNDTNETSSVTLSSFEITSTSTLSTVPLTTYTWIFSTYPTTTTTTTTTKTTTTTTQPTSKQLIKVANLTTQSPTKSTTPSTSTLMASTLSLNESKETVLMNSQSLSTSTTQKPVTTPTELVNETLTLKSPRLVKLNSSTDIGDKNTTNLFVTDNSTLLDSVEIVDQTTNIISHNSSTISGRSNDAKVESKTFNSEKAELSVSQSSRMETISILLGAFMIVSLISVVVFWKKHKKINGSSVSADSELRFLAQEEEN